MTARRVVTVVLLLGVLAGCGGEAESPEASAEPRALELSVERPKDGSKTKARAIDVVVEATEDSRVTVNGEAARRVGRATGTDRFHSRIRLKRGRNEIVVKAARAGFPTARQMLVVTRRPRENGAEPEPRQPEAPAPVEPPPDQSGGGAPQATAPPEGPQGAPPAATPSPEGPQGGPGGGGPGPAPEENPQGEPGAD